MEGSSPLVDPPSTCRQLAVNSLPSPVVLPLLLWQADISSNPPTAVPTESVIWDVEVSHATNTSSGVRMWQEMDDRELLKVAFDAFLWTTGDFTYSFPDYCEPDTLQIYADSIHSAFQEACSAMPTFT